MTPAVRLTYRGRDGRPVVEDLIGPSDWSTSDYRAAIRRQRPGVEMLAVEPITRDMVIPRGTSPALWWVTLQIPGRPLTQIQLKGGKAEVRRLALMSAEPGAQIVRVLPAND